MNMNSSLWANTGRGGSRRADSTAQQYLEILTRGDGIDVSEELRNAVVRKIGRVRQYAPHAFRARVQILRDHANRSNNQYRVTVRYEVPGNDVFAEHRAHDPLTALDVVAEKIERRLRRRKTATLARRVSQKRTNSLPSTGRKGETIHTR